MRICSPFWFHMILIKMVYYRMSCSICLENCLLKFRFDWHIENVQVTSSRYTIEAKKEHYKFDKLKDFMVQFIETYFTVAFKPVIRLPILGGSKESSFLTFT